VHECRDPPRRQRRPHGLGELAQTSGRCGPIGLSDRHGAVAVDDKARHAIAFAVNDAEGVRASPLEEKLANVARASASLQPERTIDGLSVMGPKPDGNRRSRIHQSSPDRFAVGRNDLYLFAGNRAFYPVGDRLTPYPRVPSHKRGHRRLLAKNNLPNGT
jgi:hypothetical protein